jgi:methionine-rich copper-binding protein CopC
MRKKLLVGFSLLLGTLFTNAQTKTIAYKELKSSSGAATGSGMFFGASMTTDSITITFAGPSTKWIGLGFGTSMSGTDALIYTASGGSQNWWDYYMGSTSSNSVVKDVTQNWNIKSNTVSNNVRTVVATRALNTGDNKDAVINYNAASLNIVWARSSGTSYNLADHGGSNRAYGISLSWVLQDQTPPTVATLSPADNATGIATNTGLKVTFSEPITKGTGNVTIFKEDQSIAETIDITSQTVTVNGNQLSIQPVQSLLDSTVYYVQIASTAIKDIAGNFFAGISTTSDWNFTTAAAIKTNDIKELSEVKFLKITPSSLIISPLESNYNYQISDIQGNIISEKHNAKGESIILFTDLKPAVYFITLTKDSQLIKSKFVVQ